MNIYDKDELMALAEKLNDKMPYAPALEEQLCEAYHLVSKDGYFNRDDSLVLAELKGEELEPFMVYPRAFVKPSEMIQLILRTRFNNLEDEQTKTK